MTRLLAPACILHLSVRALSLGPRSRVPTISSTADLDEFLEANHFALIGLFPPDDPNELLERVVQMDALVHTACARSAGGRAFVAKLAAHISQYAARVCRVVTVGASSDSQKRVALHTLEGGDSSSSWDCGPEPQSIQEDNSGHFVVRVENGVLHVSRRDGEGGWTWHLQVRCCRRGFGSGAPQSGSSVAAPSVVMSMPHDEGLSVYDGDLGDPAALLRWARAREDPVFMEMGPSTVSAIFEDNAYESRPTLVLLQDPGSATSGAEEAVRALAPRLRGKFLAVLSKMAGRLELKLLNTLEIDPQDPAPILAVLTFDFTGDLDYAGSSHARFRTFRMGGEITAASAGRFLDDFGAGRLRPWVRSEPLPGPEEAFVGAVRRLVGLSYQAAVEDQGRDTLVYFYTAACGWCQRFKAEYLDLAERLRHVATLDITWIDAGRNAVPQPKRFPTVALFPAGGRQTAGLEFLNHLTVNAVEFMGDILRGNRTVTAMVAWLHQEATLGFNDTAPAPPHHGEGEEAVGSGLLPPGSLEDL